MNCSDDIWDAWRKLPTFFWDTRCICEKSIYAKRCDDIQDRLKEKGIKAVVSRHTIYDTRLYLIEYESDWNDKCIYELEIANALDIPREWVALYNIDNRTTLSVKEKELNDKYSDDDGRLVFEFDFLKFINNDNFASCELNRYLREKGVKIRESFISYMEYGLIFLDSPASKYCIAKALKISDDAIVDVSTLYGGDDELTHVIILDRCKEE